ncbi:MAG: hypothetical protein EZS28_014859 [Streblomastix strix]|uniref:Uncharacterized protein n=1 Tax=Streblomastix strix TaxID=222440 RepID=A0A5J4W4Y8_9EUKA|nr:MAG: hypothetical protein EZS28_014859 [Streblomastix strix]
MENEGVIVDMIRIQRLINFSIQVIRTQSSNYPASNIADGSGFIQTIISFANIKSIFVTFAVPQQPIWFFPVLFKNIDLIIDQRHVIPSAYPALTQDVCRQMFDCFVVQDVVSASYDLYHSLVFENQYIDDKNYSYGIEIDETVGQLRHISNIFYETTFYNGFNAIKVFYPNRCYPNIKNAKLTPIIHYLCDGIVRIMFDDNPDPQVLSIEDIGEIGGSAIISG